MTQEQPLVAEFGHGAILVCPGLLERVPSLLLYESGQPHAVGDWCHPEEAFGPEEQPRIVLRFANIESLRVVMSQLQSVERLLTGEVTVEQLTEEHEATRTEEQQEVSLDWGSERMASEDHS